MAEAVTEPKVADADAFRRVISNYPTGVCLVSAIDADGVPFGMVIGSLTHVSSEPQLVAFLAMRTSRTFERLRGADKFCLNILAADQVDLCHRFTRSGATAFSETQWKPAASGAPIIDGALGALECAVASVSEHGDHFLLVASVEEAHVLRQAGPLLFFQSGFGAFSASAFVEGRNARLIELVRLAESGRTEMQAIADETGAECSASGVSGGNLIVVSTTTPAGLEAQSRVGSRVPMMPPMAEAYVAFAEHEEIEMWLGRAAASDEGSRPRYEARLALARERRWSMSRVGTISDSELTEAVREYAEGDVTPHRLRRIQEVIHNASDYYEPVDLHDGTAHEIGTIVAPVLDADERPLLVLKLSQLPSRLTGDEIVALAERLREGADRVARLQGTTSPTTLK